MPYGECLVIFTRARPIPRRLAGYTTKCFIRIHNMTVIIHRGYAASFVRGNEKQISQQMFH